MDWVLLDLSEPEVGGVDIPLELSVLLLGWFVASVGLQVHLLDLFLLAEIFIRADGILRRILIGISRLAVFKGRVGTYVREFVAATQALSNGLLLLRSILRFLQLIDEASNAGLVPSRYDRTDSF